MVTIIHVNMLKILRPIKNLYNYYCLLGSNCNRIKRLNFSSVCNVQNGVSYNIRSKNHLSFVSFHPSRDSVRFKSKGKSKNKSDVDSNDEFSDDENVLKEGELAVDGGQVRRMYVKSLRVDSILRAGFGLSKRKVEECIFNNKARLNGKPIPKKSYEISEDDEFEMFVESTDGDVVSKSLGRFVVQKIEPLIDVSMYNVYISFHKN